MKEGEGLWRLLFFSVAVAVAVGWAGTVWAQSTDTTVKPKERPTQQEEELWSEDEVTELLDQPFNPYLNKGASALDRAFGYVWEGRLEQRFYNLPMGGSLGITSEWYESGIQGAARTHDRFNVRHALALGVPAGPWWGNAQVHENTGYYVGTGSSSYVSDGEWEAKDGSRGELFADPPQTRFDVPLLAIRSLSATWPVIGGTPTWPAPEDVVGVWAGTDTWNTWKRKEGDEFYGEFDDTYATRRGTGEQSVLDVSGRFRVLQYGTLDASYFQFELTNNSSYTYTDVYVGQFQRRRLLVSDGNETFPRWDQARQFTYQIGTDYFGPADGTHTDDDGDPAPWGGWVYLNSPTGSFRKDANGDTLTPGPSTVLTRVAFVEYYQRVRDGDHEWGLYAAMSGDVDLLDDPVSANDVWKHLTQGGGSPILMQDEYVWARHVFNEPEMTDALTEINHTCFHYLSSGPITTWAPGETISFDIAFVAAPTEHELLANVDKAIRTYQAKLESSGPPPAPTLEVAGTLAGPGGRQLTMLHDYPIQYTGSGSITLTWDGTATETALDAITLNNDFQGYKIYRSIDRGNTWGDEITDENAKRVAYMPVAQFDLDDDVQGMDSATYKSLGSNTGLQHSWTDYDILDGFEYWYAITAYDYDPIQDTTYPSFESSRGANPNVPTIVAVMAGSNPGGMVPGGIDDPLLGTLSDAVLIPTVGLLNGGTVSVSVIDKSVVDDYTYSIAISDTAYYGDFMFADAPGITLKNVTTGDVLYSTLLASDADWGNDLLPKREGVKVLVNSLFDTDKYELISYEFPDIFVPRSGYEMEFGDEHFGGSSLNSDDWTTRATKMFSAEIKFDTTTTQLAYTYTRSGYAFRSIHEFPGTVWDVSGSTPRQVNVVYTVNSSDATDEWDLGVGGHGSSTRHYTSILNSDYSADVPEEVYTTGAMSDWDAGTMDKVWSFRPGVANATDTVEDLHGETAYFNYMRPIAPNTEYAFSTTASAFADSAFDADNIMVVPNPYYVRAPWDVSNNTRKIQFTNLPPNSRVDIYTLSGELVTSLDHGTLYNSTQIGTLEWNIWTYEYTEAAYGLYIYVVKVGEEIKKVGKFAIIR